MENLVFKRRWDWIRQYLLEWDRPHVTSVITKDPSLPSTIRFSPKIIRASPLWHPQRKCGHRLI